MFGFLSSATETILSNILEIEIVINDMSFQKLAIIVENKIRDLKLFYIL